MIDLGAWASESYRVSLTEEADDPAALEPRDEDS